VSGPILGESAATCLSRILGAIRARDVLDVGCGDGSFTRTLADMLASWRSIIGIDPDKDSIDDARRFTDHRRIRYRVLSALQTSFHEGRFDLVAISNALHHVDDPAAVLCEMRRLVADDGLLVVQELVSDGLTPAEENGKRVHHWKARIDRLRGRAHRETYARDEVRDLVRHADAVIEAECEVVDNTPSGSDSERITDAVSMFADYLELVRGEREHGEMKREAERITRSLHAYGIAVPPRLVIRARFRP
jgi:ubiquinone/menaquinone biosynthesis C-methylase UbiE